MRTRGVLLAAMLAVGTVGCSSIAEKATERVLEEAAGAGGEEVDIDLQDGSFRIETSEGTFESGTGDLPDGFPDQMPLPDDHVVVASMGSSDDSGSSALVNLEVPSSVEDMVAFYQDRLPAEGWEITGTTQSTTGDGSWHALQVAGHGLEGTVNLSDLADVTTVSITLGPAA